MNYDTMSRDDLIAMIETLSYDQSFGILKKERGILEYGNIADGTDVIYLDLCNVHAANHLYTNDGYDCFVRNVTDKIKHSDAVIKFGGDELVIIPRNGTHIVEYLDRLTRLLRDNNIYAVIAYTQSVNGLTATVKTLDKIVSAEKKRLEENGLKPSRDEAYKVLDSIIIEA